MRHHSSGRYILTICTFKMECSRKHYYGSREFSERITCARSLLACSIHESSVTDTPKSFDMFWKKKEKARRSVKKGANQVSGIEGKLLDVAIVASACFSAFQRRLPFKVFNEPVPVSITH